MSEGAEVDGNVGSNRLPTKARTAAQKPAAANTKTDAASTLGGKGGWSILLASFSETNHRAMAEAARNSFAQRYPILRTAQVRTLSSGSTVVLGRYEGPKDPAAQAELKRVKEVGTGGERPFARAMLVRVTANPAAGPPSPNDLRMVRRDRPEGTLYTLQVAAWAALGTKELTMEQIKRSAENYAQQLRTQGYEAYCYHDYDVETSIVSVGVFGHDAFDSKSTLYAPEVEAVMRKFPKSLVNGEEVRVPVDPKSPNGKTVVQGPRLVEIPKF